MRCRTVQVFGGYTTGTSPVHGRYITGSAGPSPDTAAPGTLRRYGAAVHSTHRSARHGAVPVSPPRRRRARSLAPATALTGWRGLIRQPGAGRARPAGRPARAGRQNPSRPEARQSSLRRASRCPTEGQNRRGSAKRAVIRTASFARTLYTICTCTVPYIDPAVTRTDARRDKKETARRARFRSQGAVFAGGGRCCGGRCWVRTNVG
jgi:hypothetical protein